MNSPYYYTIPNVDLTQLYAECVAAGLPVTNVQGGAQGSPDAWIHTSRDLDSAEKTTLDGVVAAHDGRPRRPRTIYAISNDIFTKTSGAFAPTATGQKLLIINDMFTGNLAVGGQRWQQDAGRNGAALCAVYAAVMNANAAAVFFPSQQLVMTAMYAQDYPNYLVHPAFDPTINIPGDEPYEP